MAIPDFQSIMLPLLRLTADGKDHSRKDTEPALAMEFGLNDEDRARLLPSGRQAVFNNRLHWARTHLAKAGLLEAPSRGVFRITDEGRKVLKAPPDRITLGFLAPFPGYQEFRGGDGDGGAHPPPVLPDPIQATPEEALEDAYQQRREDLIADLLARIKQASPAFFERLVVDLLVTMGYGGSRQDAGSAIGKSGDEGIDGVIKEDKLGLDLIYLQAKRWENVVSRPVVQQFAGALHGQKAKKGVFITTSSFTKEARDYVAKVETRIVLIGGRELAALMIDHNVAVTLERTYEIKRVDLDFFTEE